MAFMRLKSACETGGVSLEAGVEKAISSLITPNDYINGGLSLAAALEKFVKTREALNSRSSTIADYSTYITKAQKFFRGKQSYKDNHQARLGRTTWHTGASFGEEGVVCKAQDFLQIFPPKGVDRRKYCRNAYGWISQEGRRKSHDSHARTDRACFQVVAERFGCFAGYALWAFAGLRPEEVCPKDKKGRLEWSAINFNERVITVCGSVSKVRKNRKLQNLPENLWRFLELTPPEKRIGAVCTKSYSTMRRIRRKIPLELPKDIFRHSFATYGYYKYDPKDLIVMMGHLRGFTTFEKHYMGLADRASAKKYFAIMPQK